MQPGGITLALRGDQWHYVRVGLDAPLRVLLMVVAPACCRITSQTGLPSEGGEEESIFSSKPEVKLDSLSSPKHPGFVPTLLCITKEATASWSSFPSSPSKPSWIHLSFSQAAPWVQLIVSQNSAIKPPEDIFFISKCSVTAACKPCAVLGCRRFPGAQRAGLQRMERGVFNPPSAKSTFGALLLLSAGYVLV